MPCDKRAAQQLRQIEHVLKSGQPRPETDTDTGRLRGVHDQGCLSFRGIPYAMPPLGDRRFRVAEPVETWPGMREARDFGPACPQLAGTDITENGNNVIHEDSLTLNVWTPALDGRRPVMVWLHGGAFIEGSARNAWYNGAALAAAGDVVVVTLQYRLGVFGFLHLAEVGGPEFAESGNLGLLDQVEALRWLRRNLAAFGGDPDNVTLFGESAGGASVAMLLSMPAARGLFHKAIVQSMSPQLGRSPQRSAAATRELMTMAGARTVQDLQALRTADLLALQKQAFDAGTADNLFWPTVDGVVLHQHAIDGLRDGHGAPMPVMIGTTLDEVRFWTEIEDVALLRKPAGTLAAHLRRIAGEQSDAVSVAYGLDATDADEGRLQLAGDLVFRLPSIRMAEHLVGHGQPVWMYLFTYRSTSTVACYQSAHAMELPFLFGALEEPSAVAFTGRSPGREALSRCMQQAWTRFARTGTPAADGLPDWPRYAVHSRCTMELGLVPRVLRDPMPMQRQCWGDLPFDARAPDEVAVGSLMFDAD